MISDKLESILYTNSENV